eukprot:TRINITY_DN73885_c0_g1_i1.p1 TRINITY_DN73885_c0_g1~~TRINITY_DN73885_c0_g1_i1.p1  ORF type:complete len:295 (+),score=80.84 TRINITY_DN73885_c0_g1_i1:59-886(+)
MAPSPLRICTVNVLFEVYYQRHSKAGYLVPLAERTGLFEQWLEGAAAAHDVIAFQEWPYSGVQAESWYAVVQAAAQRHGHTVVGHASTPADGLLMLVRTAAWTVTSSRSQLFSREAGNKGWKRMMAVVLESPSRERVGVINAHVPWAPRFHQGCFNTSQLFGMVSHEADAWVAVGDWNVPVRDSQRAEFTRTCLPEGWTDMTQQMPAHTCMGDRGPSKIDYIAASPGVMLASGAPSVHPPTPQNNVLHANVPGTDPRRISWFSDHSAVSATLMVS